MSTVPGPVYPLNSRYTVEIEPGDDHQQVVQLIDRATRTIAVALAGLGDPRVTTALIRAHERGVEVSVALPRGLHPSPSARALADANITIGTAAPGMSALSVDGDIAAVATAGLPDLADGPARRAAIVYTRNATQIDAVTTFMTTARVTESEGLVQGVKAIPAAARIIAAARGDLVVETGSLTNSEITQAITSVAQRGVPCRVVTNRPGAGNQLDALVRAGCRVRVHENAAIALNVITTDAGVAVGSASFDESPGEGMQLLSLPPDPRTVDGYDDLRTTPWADFAQGATWPGSR